MAREKTPRGAAWIELPDERLIPRMLEALYPIDVDRRYVVHLVAKAGRGKTVTGPLVKVDGDWIVVQKGDLERVSIHASNLKGVRISVAEVNTVLLATEEEVPECSDGDVQSPPSEE